MESKLGAQMWMVEMIVCLPGTQEVGQGLHSLKGVTTQSIWQGTAQDRIDSGRDDSGQLKLSEYRFNN